MGLGAATRKVGEVGISVVVRRLRGVPADSGDAQRLAILEDSLESLRLFSSLSYSEFPETFTTRRYSPPRRRHRSRLKLDRGIRLRIHGAAR
jgi:hypothetical protein